MPSLTWRRIRHRGERCRGLSIFNSRSRQVVELATCRRRGDRVFHPVTAGTVYPRDGPGLRRASEPRRFVSRYELAGQQILLFHRRVCREATRPRGLPRTRSESPLSRFYMSRHMVKTPSTEFNPIHSRKTGAGAGDRHPVLYLSTWSDHYCQSPRTRERKKISSADRADGSIRARTRRPQVSVGEITSIGGTSRTSRPQHGFAWSDRDMMTVTPKALVGAFPFGASPFGMKPAGNVWNGAGLLRALPQHGEGEPHGLPAGQIGLPRRHLEIPLPSPASDDSRLNVPNYSCNDLGFRSSRVRLAESRYPSPSARLGMTLFHHQKSARRSYAF